MTARRLLLIAALMLLAITPAAGAATARPPVTPGSRYLALGDSVTFGYEEATVVPAPDYHNPASLIGYPEQLGPQLELKVTNAACPGETSDSFINAKAMSNGCENIIGKPGGYRVLYPLHARYTGSQLAFAVEFLRTHRDVRLVSLMIGANDVFICEESTADHCLNPSELSATLAKVKRNVRTIVSALRTKAHYRGQLVIEQYYSPDYSNSFLTAASRALNQAQDAGAEPFGVQLADGFGLFGKAAEHSGGNPCTAGLLTQTPRPPSCGIHPSDAGQALLAQAVADAVRLAAGHASVRASG